MSETYALVDSESIAAERTELIDSGKDLDVLLGRLTVLARLHDEEEEEDDEDFDDDDFDDEDFDDDDFDDDDDDMDEDDED
jgi:hypothetical protein